MGCGSLGKLGTAFALVRGQISKYIKDDGSKVSLLEKEVTNMEREGIPWRSSG